nr:nascent polypeptide-associated complex subunit alpha, muscle-specific form-like [Aegilops tauschii subsp. strangulata]
MRGDPEWSAIEATIIRWFYQAVSKDIFHTVVVEDDDTCAVWAKINALFTDNKLQRLVHAYHMPVPRAPAPGLLGPRPAGHQVFFDAPTSRTVLPSRRHPSVAMARPPRRHRYLHRGTPPSWEATGTWTQVSPAAAPPVPTPAPPAWSDARRSPVVPSSRHLPSSPGLSTSPEVESDRTPGCPAPSSKVEPDRVSHPSAAAATPPSTPVGAATPTTPTGWTSTSPVATPAAGSDATSGSSAPTAPATVAPTAAAGPSAARPPPPLPRLSA